ncbi:MAG: hypothetical protein PQJ60_11895, partial [Spirochaetales bacterium]|nr:hypothetical protein [Spirochaetales bacterium]
KEALLLQLLLKKKKISLTKDQWKELWNHVKEGTPMKEEDKSPLSLLSREEESHSQPWKGEAYFQIFRDRKGKGSLLLSLEEEKGDRMTLCLDRGGRKWEFHLSRSSSEKKQNTGKLLVYTDDEKLITHPPPSWDEFRRAMAGYGISVEKRMKTLQIDPFFVDNGDREPDHMVDITL